MIQGYGLDKNAAGGVLFCMALGAILGPSLVGILCAHRWVSTIPKVTLLALASGLSLVLGMPMLAVSPVLPTELLPVWSLLFGVFCGEFWGVALVRVQEVYAPNVVGTATGMVNIYSYIGTALLQLVSGLIMEWRAPGQDAYHMADYASMFVLFAVMFGVAFVATLLDLKYSAPMEVELSARTDEAVRCR